MRWIGALVFMLWAATCTAQPVIPLTTATIPVTLTAATTIQLVGASVAPQSLYVTGINFVASGAGTVQLVYGTGTNCGTGTGNLTGAITVAVGTVIAYGTGTGIILIVPQGNALCATTGTGAAGGGSLAYARF